MGGRVVFPRGVGKPVIADIFESGIRGRGRRLLLFGHVGSVSTIGCRCHRVDLEPG